MTDKTPEATGQQGEREPDGAVDLSSWQRMTTTDEPRLGELVAFYKELDFEVLLRPVSRQELGEECQECYLAQPERYRTIYVRAARH